MKLIIYKALSADTSPSTQDISISVFILSNILLANSFILLKKNCFYLNRNNYYSIII